MKYEIRFSGRAVRDMERVLARTLADFGQRQRDAYESLMRDAIAAILTDPFAPPARHRPELHPDVRTFHIGRRGRQARHFFMYKLVGGQRIDVGRLLHDSMDLRRHLPRGFGRPT